jgi:hypothetical protein
MEVRPEVINGILWGLSALSLAFQFVQYGRNFLESRIEDREAKVELQRIERRKLREEYEYQRYRETGSINYEYPSNYL